LEIYRNPIDRELYFDLILEASVHKSKEGSGITPLYYFVKCEFCENVREKRSGKLMI